jgi:hypothetical protein
MGGRKKAAWVVLLVVLLGGVIAAPALAADTATVDISMQNGVVSISIDSTAWDTGPQALGAWALSSFFTLSNTGNVPVDLAVSGTDATQVGGPGTWTLLDRAIAPSTDEFWLEADPLEGFGMQVSHTPGPLLYSGAALAAATDYSFRLRLWMPPSVTHRGTYTSHMTITATEHIGG